MAGSITLVYDHHVRHLSAKLTGMQREFRNHVLSTPHVHLDHDHCLEVLVVRRKASLVQKSAHTLIAT